MYICFVSKSLWTRYLGCFEACKLWNDIQPQEFVIYEYCILLGLYIETELSASAFQLVNLDWVENNLLKLIGLMYVATGKVKFNHSCSCQFLYSLYSVICSFAFSSELITNQYILWHACRDNSLSPEEL